MSNFARNGFNDRVQSAVVHDGRWEICVDADFGGGCSILAPGAYPNLGAYAGRISSVRPIDGRYSGQPRGHDDTRPATAKRARRSTKARICPDARYPLNDTMQNLGTTGFNDRASSLRVESGYWIFCSDSEFRGECRTFGPGDYASLPGLNNVDLVGAHDLERLSVRRPAGLAA